MRCDYILFTHLPTNKWEHLEKWAGPLIKILAHPNPGILVVFNDEGWLSLLNTVGADFDPRDLSEGFHKIDCLQKQLDDLLEKHPEATEETKVGKSGKERKLHRVRLVTAADLNPIVNNLRGNKLGNEATRLRKFLVSDELGVRYDTAKVVEALVRIRHVGSGIPVIRIDWDALLNRETLDKHLSTSLLRVMSRCELYAREPLIHSSMMSGGYSQPPKKRGDWNLSDFNVAYATRVFPALIPTKMARLQLDDRLKEVPRKDKHGKVSIDYVDCDLVETKSEDEEEASTQAELDELNSWGMFESTVVNSFYGSESGIPWSGISQFGAHPCESVISGSLLVLNDGAILDLPPFSNFRRNVMWIDDHLKYLLHQSLGHFRRLELNLGTVGKPAMFKPRVDGVEVYKDRLLAGQGNLRRYTLGVYIPTLFWGTIMDAWIQPNTELKRPVIPELDQEAGPFAKFLGRALRSGSFLEEEREALREELFEIARDRAEEVRNKWKELKKGKQKSFAALWVSGKPDEVNAVLSVEMKDQLKDDKDWIGWGLLNKKREELINETGINSLEDLSKPVREGIRVLVEDAITYIDWAIEWPSFVRSVRAVRSGTLNLDASFEPENSPD